MPRRRKVRRYELTFHEEKCIIFIGTNKEEGKVDERTREKQETVSDETILLLTEEVLAEYEDAFLELAK